jgi:hypothetical protein
MSSDDTPSVVVNSALMKHVLRVALVHAPTSEKQAQELMTLLKEHGVDTIIVNVSFALASAIHALTAA